MKTTTKGILLIAIGSGYYGQMAQVLANSIKLSNPIIQIAIITDRESLAPLRRADREVFDKIIRIDDMGPERIKYTIDQGVFNPFKTKTFMYDLTPFDHTLYLDADAICMNNNVDVKELFDQLDQHDFQMYEVKRFTINSADQSHTVWTEDKNGQQLKNIWKAYKIDKDAIYPEYNSSFIWFKKNAANKKYFKRVQKNYMTRKIAYQKIGRHYPDELAFGIASAQLKHYSAIEGYRPIYFAWTEVFTTIKEMAKTYWFIGYAAGRPPSKLERLYNNISKSNAVKTGRSAFKLDPMKKAFSIK